MIYNFCTACRLLQLSRSRGAGSQPGTSTIVKRGWPKLQLMWARSHTSMLTYLAFWTFSWMLDQITEEQGKPPPNMSGWYSLLLLFFTRSTSSLPANAQSQRRGLQRRELQEHSARSSPLVRQQASHRGHITDDTSDTETSVHNTLSKVPEQQQQQPPPAQQGQRRSLSPCSQVDQAVLGYLRGREGADWAELYCALLVPSFRALLPHIVPKMKVAVETI
ncbi:hypothetical protein GDO78_023157 [Eleutherodactylus coqui]|uniref:Uncharacterized protein n=1 Tax=Eleutherodactylus coqui TaxID=57060 RepID=A0A8J6B8X5_ELECQ|nr:hypothetical protein GDO78_023157 [Eleutherodactylus coqui]